jgi:hypothetical protein
MNKESWISIAGYQGLYDVSNIGNVRSIGRKVKYNHHATGETHFRNTKEKILKISTNKGNGYKYINLHHPITGVTTISIHRLVAIHFINNKNADPCVNHIDGIKANNVVSNLEWCTHKENSIHSSKNNLTPKGENHYKSTLSDSDIFDIRRSKRSIPALAKHYGVEYRSMWQIVKGITR